MDDASPRTLELLLQETTHHLDASLSAIRDIDQKIEALARFDAILVGLVVTGVSVWSRVGTPWTTLSTWVLVSFAIGITAAIASATIALWAHLGSAMAVGLHPRELKSLLSSEIDDRTLARTILLGYIDAIGSNYLVMERTAKGYRLALFGWLISISTLAIAALGLLADTVQ